MLSRIRHQQKAIEIPEKIKTEFTAILNEQFADFCAPADRTFFVYGAYFPSEILLIASLHSPNAMAEIPISVFVSADLPAMDADKKALTTEYLQATLNDMFDAIGSIFDHIFQQVKNPRDFIDYEPNWQDIPFKERSFHSKVNRENIFLTFEADRLLGEEFLNEEL